jgi:hypothetical protein
MRWPDRDGYPRVEVGVVRVSFAVAIAGLALGFTVLPRMLGGMITVIGALGMGLTSARQVGRRNREEAEEHAAERAARRDQARE